MLVLLDLLLVFTGVYVELASRPGYVAMSDYVQFVTGDMNLLISVPHDGHITPEHMPNRRNGTKRNGVCDYSGLFSSRKSSKICKSVMQRDFDASVIALEMAAEFKKLSGRSPYFVIGRLHRTKVDFNRPILEAAQNDKSAEQAYSDYHQSIEAVRNRFEGPGLVIDLHGQTNKQNSTELGYLIKTGELNARNYNRTSSARALLERHNMSIQEFLHGPNSLGAMFEEEGYKAVPSPRQPIPGKDRYFRGGFITQQYGSDRGGQIDSLQIEMPSESRYEDGPEARIKYAKALARILVKFVNRYY